MISRFGVFCKVLESGSFTKAADSIGYSQSAVSQTIKSLEEEIGAVLIERGKDGLSLTADGKEYYPYIKSIAAAESALLEKEREMSGLSNSTIKIGTFTSVSRNLLPPLIKNFRKIYPQVNFILRQGEYTSIAKWIKEGSIDFGFVNESAVSGIETELLYEDEMMAVFPKGNVLSKKSEVTLKELCREPLILLDEGEHSVPLDAFAKAGVKPNIAYEVYDDYTILAMVKQGLGISIMYKLVLSGFEEGLEIRKIREAPQRSVAIAFKNKETMSYASRKFADYIIKNIKVDL